MIRSLFKIVIAGVINSVDYLKRLVIEGQIDSLVIFCPGCGKDINDHDSFIKRGDRCYC